MKVHTAQLAGGTTNADRVFVTKHAVIVLDGASAFEPVDVGPDTYAETLGAAIAEQLDPQAPIADGVARAISHTTNTLGLRAGASPSSTVAILRTGERHVDLYVLGDSPIFYGRGVAVSSLTDDRLEALPLPERERYSAALRDGAGYTDEHHATLATLQRGQRERRNIEGGYWIAETDPSAAHHARMLTLERATIEWAVLATDGAADVLRHLGKDDWPTIARLDDTALAALLADLHEWEAQHDPDGEHLPRAKRHDDKTIAAVSEV